MLRRNDRDDLRDPRWVAQDRACDQLMQTRVLVLTLSLTALMPDLNRLHQGYGASAGALAKVQARPPFDLVVYGGTAGGVITAVAAAREGLKVALVSPDRHLGGMVS